jgi:anti-anti-sigma factor
MSTITYDSLLIDYEIKEINDKKIEVLIFTGRIGNQNSFQISEEFYDLLDHSIPNMIIGLKDLEYLNSQGLAFLLSLIKRVEELGGVFLIGGVNKLIETIIQLVEVSDQVIIFPSMDDALASWK